MSNQMFFKVPKGTKGMNLGDTINGRYEFTLQVETWINCNHIHAIDDNEVCINVCNDVKIFYCNENFRPEHVWNPERCIPFKSNEEMNNSIFIECPECSSQLKVKRGKHWPSGTIIGYQEMRWMECSKCDFSSEIYDNEDMIKKYWLKEEMDNGIR